MPSLSRDHRRLLKKAIAGESGARRIAEDGAERSLQRLAVDKHEPHTSLTVEERMLRNQLRAHGRQLGDKRDPQRGNQTITHLKQAVAYEHWHRMLFARFLAENDLLLHPDHGVSLSLDEIKQLALSRNCDWIELAADYAQRMLLSAVFRPEDPVLRVPLPVEKRLELEGNLNALPREVFIADDGLGWVYQFWQEDAKDEVNKSRGRIGADELPSVTQLFTEDYMVLFLLENTLGAWWTARNTGADLPGYSWRYLRLNDDGTPSAGSFRAWPHSTKELRILDPCMGSGHFLTYALPILARMRVAEEGIDFPVAISAVLRENLFGLELDPRCSQIAAFNLALTAWKLNGQHFELPPLNLACSGLAINAKEEDWVRLGGNDTFAQATMRKLYNMFSDAPTLGSLIDPTKVGDGLFDSQFHRVRPYLEKALTTEQSTDDERELAIAAQGLLAAANTLSEKFTLVATNVPYLGRAKQAPVLAAHCEEYFKRSKGDLATCFLERCITYCREGGTVATVIPQTWLFLKTFAGLRKKLLPEVTFDVIVKLGANAFRDMNWWAAVTALNVITVHAPAPEWSYAGIDVGDTKDQIKKASLLCERSMSRTLQRSQLQNPQHVITFQDLTGRSLLREFATSTEGLSTGDGDRFLRKHWEFPSVGLPWDFFQVNPEITAPFTGMSDVICWEDGLGELSRSPAARIQGHAAWGKPGILVSSMNRLRCSLYLGTKYDKMCVVLVPRSQQDLPSIWEFVASDDFHEEIRQITQKVHVSTSTFLAVPFDKGRWQESTRKNSHLDLPGPQSSDPTQWLFDGFPAHSDSPLQVAVARLLGYRWPRQSGSSLPGCREIGPDGLDSYADSNGIVCLPSIAGEDGAGTRLRSLLRTVYGQNVDIGRFIGAKKSKRIEDWLLDEFFEEHCRIFQPAPFIWHVWDGRRDGFNALLNYHRLDRANLEKLIYSYLGDWLARQRQDVENGVEGADSRVASAEHLQNELKKILEGECSSDKKSGYDIFVRWKPLKEQPIGWFPDLNDGVRVNIRPWIAAARLYRATKPGILRVHPHIKYTKDRGDESGRDPKDYPWFKTSSERVNDLHVTLAEKRAARGMQ